MTEHTRGAAVVSIDTRQKQTQKPEQSQISVSASSPRKGIIARMCLSDPRKSQIKKLEKQAAALLKERNKHKRALDRTQRKYLFAKEEIQRLKKS